MLKNIIAYFIGGVAGGIVYGFMSGWKIPLIPLYALAFGITIAIGELVYSLINVQLILKALIFGATMGIIGGMFTYFAKGFDHSFLKAFVPTFGGVFVGGSLYKILFKPVYSYTRKE